MVPGEELWGVPSLIECQERCAKSASCLAYQYASLGRYAVCELFSVEPVQGTLPMPGYTCFQKINALTPSTAAPPGTGGRSAKVHAVAPPMENPPPAFLPPPPYLHLPPPMPRWVWALPPPTPQWARALPPPVPQWGSRAVTKPPAAAPTTAPPLATHSSNIMIPYGGIAGPSPCLFMVKPYADFAQANCLNLRNSDLRYADLTGANLDAVDLSGSMLDYSWLMNAALDSMSSSSVSFQFANMTLASFEGSELSNSDFTGAILQRAELRSAKFEASKFTHAQLQEASFQDSLLNRATLVGANLYAAKLEGIEATAADFTSANLRSAVLTTSKLQGASFRGAHLHHAVFTDAWIHDADFTGAAGLDTADFTMTTGTPKGMLFSAARTIPQHHIGLHTRGIAPRVTGGHSRLTPTGNG